MKKALAVLLLAVGSLFSSFAGSTAYANTSVYGNSPAYLTIDFSSPGTEMGIEKKPKPPLIPGWVWALVGDFVSYGIDYVMENWGQGDVDEACSCYEAEKNNQGDPDDEDADEPNSPNFNPYAAGEDWNGLEELCG